jgi:dTDP-4-amino-4,6-dideoxygalactose transaminase
VPKSTPFVDLSRQHDEIKDDLRAAFDRVLSSSAFTLGPEVEAFERDFAGYCATPDCVGVSSGTSALGIMLRAAGIGPGDEVILPAHTFIASALGVVQAGATPVYADVEDGTGLLDPAAAEAAVSSRTAAILAVHLYGQVCAMDRLAAVAERHGLALFEDAAQAHGATCSGRRAGSLGLGAAFSFYPSKNLGALGDGGAITTADPALAERARRLRNLGQRAKYDHVELGFNDRLDGLQAALLRAKLPYLDGWNAARQAAAAALRARLEGQVVLLEERPETPSIHHLFPIRVVDRDAVADALGRAGVATGIHYSPAAYVQPPLAALGAPAEGTFPVADAWARDELSLPMFPGLRPDQVEHIAAATTEAVGLVAGRMAVGEGVPAQILSMPSRHGSPTRATRSVG